MKYSFDIDRMASELRLGQDAGFNALRVVLPFVVWDHEPGAFHHRFDSFLDVAWTHGMRVVPCFFDDCAFGDAEELKNPRFARQPDVRPGWYANGWTPSPGHDLVRDESAHPQLEAYVTDILSAHRNDSRILMWDLYNEPGNGGLGNDSVPLLQKVFSWARNARPEQPVTSGIWNHKLTDIHERLLAVSDVITFHHYGGPDRLRAQITQLKAHGRPLICTEWLNRASGSTVQDCLPVFAEERVGCLHWGLVNGRTQTHLHWGSRPDEIRAGVWQHDLFHGDHRPYDASELECFKRIQHTMSKTLRSSL